MCESSFCVLRYGHPFAALSSTSPLFLSHTCVLGAGCGQDIGADIPTAISCGRTWGRGSCRCRCVRGDPGQAGGARGQPPVSPVARWRLPAVSCRHARGAGRAAPCGRYRGHLPARQHPRTQCVRARRFRWVLVVMGAACVCPHRTGAGERLAATRGCVSLLVARLSFYLDQLEDRPDDMADLPAAPHPTTVVDIARPEVHCRHDGLLDVDVLVTCHTNVALCVRSW